LSRIASVSGVVLRTCGVVSSIRWRSLSLVSPCLMACLISVSWPRSASRSAIPDNGRSKFRWMSLASDFSGETYRQ
jgi:hypothetical protein